MGAALAGKSCKEMEGISRNVLLPARDVRIMLRERVSYKADQNTYSMKKYII